MTEGISNNLNAHYSTQAKVERSAYTAVMPAQNIPRYNVYTDIEGTKRWNSINQEINAQIASNGPKRYKKTPKSAAMKNVSGNNFDSKKFWNVYLGIVAAILAAIGIRKFFK